MTRTSRFRRVLVAFLAALLLVVSGGPMVSPLASAGAFSLSLGDPALPETRNILPVAPGVELVRIVRGDQAAAADEIATTTRGPWRINVLGIDPHVATGHLAVTFGPDLARTETTSTLVSTAGALAGVNASFFTFTSNPQYPGDPVGLGLYAGQLLSEPEATAAEVDVLIDARTGTVRFGRTTWSGTVRNTQTRVALALKHLNSPPKVPAACATLADPTACTRSGDVVRFTPAFAAATPSGPGVEVVLDRKGCVVRTARTRGTALTRAQTSLQATGRQSRSLLRLTNNGCLSTRLTLRDAQGKTVKRHRGLFGVAGRYRLTQNGQVVVPNKTSAFFARHPRTLIGTTANGTIALVTIDGRQATSVGATLHETAAIAASLGLTDSVNLDGGGSTTMVAAGQLVNQPSAGVQRAVGDALLYIDRRAA